MKTKSPEPSTKQAFIQCSRLRQRLACRWIQQTESRHTILPSVAYTTVCQNSDCSFIMRCSVCDAVISTGAAWGPCAPNGHLSMVCSSCNVAPPQRSAPKTVANATPSMLERIKASSTALDVVQLVSEPESRKALVAALAAGRVICVDGGRIIAA